MYPSVFLHIAKEDLHGDLPICGILNGKMQCVPTLHWYINDNLKCQSQSSNHQSPNNVVEIDVQCIMMNRKGSTQYFLHSPSYTHVSG